MSIDIRVEVPSAYGEGPRYEKRLATISWMVCSVHGPISEVVRDVEEVFMAVLPPCPLCGPVQTINPRADNEGAGPARVA
jgi:hypothetical protein